MLLPVAFNCGCEIKNVYRSTHHERQFASMFHTKARTWVKAGLLVGYHRLCGNNESADDDARDVTPKSARALSAGALQV